MKIETTTYIKDFVDDKDNIFARLKTELPWVRRDKTPRLEVYMNDHDVPYTYGMKEYARTYYPVPYHKDVLNIRVKLETLLNCKLDVCFLNMYENQSDHLGWHADNSREMDDERPIVSISLGAEREIWYRTNKLRADSMVDEIDPPGVNMLTNGERADKIKEIMMPTKVKLEHGSAFIMSKGMQDTHEHRIPKAGFMCGERISLTFRGYVDL